MNFCVDTPVYEVGAAGFWFRNRASRKPRLPRIVRAEKKIVNKEIDLKQYARNFFEELKAKYAAPHHQSAR